MAVPVHLIFLCSILLGYVSVSRACSCQLNLKDLECSSDYVILAQVLEERQMTSQGDVFHYNLRVTYVLKTSEAYEASEKTMQIHLRGDSCGDRLKKGNVYMFTGHVVEYLEDGEPRNILETEYCQYIDVVDLTEDLFLEIFKMMRNPPACVQARDTTKDVLRSINSPRALGKFYKRRRWNNPFQKRRQSKKI